MQENEQDMTMVSSYGELERKLQHMSSKYDEMWSRFNAKNDNEKILFDTIEDVSSKLNASEQRITQYAKLIETSEQRLVDLTIEVCSERNKRKVPPLFVQPMTRIFNSW